MKPYGVKRKDKGCCPGHDKYTKKDKEKNTKVKRRLKPAKKRARRISKEEELYNYMCIYT